MNTPRVLNKRTDEIPPDAVYVGRPSKWGNPMTIKEVTRLFPSYDKFEAHQAAKEWYRTYLAVPENDVLRSCLYELKGKDLVCWCAPLPCHADVLLELANKEQSHATQ